MTRQEALDFAIKEQASGKRRVIYGPRLGVVRDEETGGIPGLVVSDEDMKIPLSGRVVKIGLGIDTTDAKDELAGMQIGDTVYFSKYHPTLFKITVGDEEVEMLLMHAGDVYMGEQDVPAREEQIGLFDTPPYADAPEPSLPAVGYSVDPELISGTLLPDIQGGSAETGHVDNEEQK